MRLLTAILCCVVATLAYTTGQHNPGMGDNLKAALQAVSRRQLDMDNTEPGYFALSSYLYSKDNEDDEDMPFLSEARNFNEDGQPENIGYGFQKSAGNGGGSNTFASQLSSENEQELLTELALEYLESELKNDNEDQFYPSVNDAEKRSAFRERDMAKVEDVRKRAPLPMSTVFRERAHQSEENDNQRRRVAESVIRKMEEEREEEEAEEQEREYERVIGNLMDKYGGPGHNEVDVEKLSVTELGELLDFLGENGAPSEDVDEIRSELEKRYDGGSGYGAGYDFFNNGAMMGGGFGYRKRSKQQLDDNDASENAFLFSLKFVSPELNREAVEQMREYDGIDPAGENDYDVLKLNMKYNEDDDDKTRVKGWLPVVESPEREEYESPNPQSLMHSHNAAKKRNKLSKFHNVPTEYIFPERNIDKKFLYDRALLKRKRFPVSKRSSNYYTSPPLLHHHVGERKKKDTPESHSTDPKVANEISHIFSSQNDENSNESLKITPQIIGNHVVNKQKAVPAKVRPTSSTTTTEAGQYEQHNQSVIEDRPNEEEIDLPVTMSRLERPIEIKKKSIDWSDYFGLDRRRKKVGSTPRSDVDEDWLMNKYYRILALSNNPNEKHKKTVPMQPFDTRIFDADIFQRNEAKKSRVADDDSRIDNMDSKLRNMEDLIVNEALKYTGAHQGATDSKEVQEVKDKVMSRLAAAYNLEKMRKALGDFKSSLAAQKMSKYNPMEQEDVKKRVVIKNERPEGRYEKEKKVFMKKNGEDYNNDFDPQGRFGKILDQPEMDGLESHDSDECPVLHNIAKKCQAAVGEQVARLGAYCTLHQICYLCGSDGESQPPIACDGLFVRKAEKACNGEAGCGETAVRVILGLTGRYPTELLYGMAPQCWERFCTAHAEKLA